MKHKKHVSAVVIATGLQQRCNRQIGLVRQIDILIAAAYHRAAEIIFINKTKLSRPMVRCGDKYINLADEPNLTIASLL